MLTNFKPVVTNSLTITVATRVIPGRRNVSCPTLSCCKITNLL